MPRIIAATADEQTNWAQLDLGAAYATLFEAPDFSMADTAGRFVVRDPGDGDRTVRPGELWIPRPVIVFNRSASTAVIDVQILSEDGVNLDLMSREIPAGEGAPFAFQGISLFKRSPGNADGDRLQMRASVNPGVAAFGWYTTRLASDHILTSELATA